MEPVGVTISSSSGVSDGIAFLVSEEGDAPMEEYRRKIAVGTFGRESDTPGKLLHHDSKDESNLYDT